MIPIIVALTILLVLIFAAAASKRKANKNRTANKQQPIRWSNDFQNGLKSTPNSKQYDWKLQETWEDYPFPDYDAYHTYCSVAFDASGKTFYYRTRNPELKVGDTVYVPFGRKYEKRIGKIIHIEEFQGRNVPYPLGRTKHIIGKVK